MQTDPIGPHDDANLYPYTGNDPVNFVDPTGTNIYVAHYANGASCTFTVDSGGSATDVSCTGTDGGDIGSYLSTLNDWLAHNDLPDSIVITAQRNQGGGEATLWNAGLNGNIPTPPSNLPHGPYTPKPATPGNRAGSFQGPSQTSGPRSQAQYVPPEAEGGPPGSQGYFKVQPPGETGWQRFDLNGNPLTPEQAHPNPIGPTRPFFFLTPIGGLLCLLFCESPAY